VRDRETPQHAKPISQRSNLQGECGVTFPRDRVLDCFILSF
jgi:hypothetical protein